MIGAEPGPARRPTRRAAGRGHRRRRRWWSTAPPTTRHHVGNQGAEDRLGVAVAVDVRGVDQGAAGADEGLQLRRRRVGVGVPTPGHRAEAQPGHLEAAAADATRIHVGQPSLAGAVGWPGVRGAGPDSCTGTVTGALCRACRVEVRQVAAASGATAADVRQITAGPPYGHASKQQGAISSVGQQDAHRPEPGVRDDGGGTGRQHRPGPGRRIAGFRHRLGGGGLRIGRGHGAGRRRGPHPPDRHRLGGAADPRPHPGHDGDDGRDPGRAVRRAVPPRARRVRTAGLRGLARRPVRRSARPHPGVRADRPAGAEAAAG